MRHRHPRWRSLGAGLMRQPPTTTSCVAEMKATKKEPATVQASAWAGSPNARQARIAKLGEEHPGAATAEKRGQSRNIDPVDDRRPEEFESVSESNVAQEADLGSRDANFAQPRRLLEKMWRNGRPELSRAPASAQGADP
jgi:hypothetical protein